MDWAIFWDVNFVSFVVAFVDDIDLEFEPAPSDVGDLGFEDDDVHNGG